MDMGRSYLSTVIAHVQNTSWLEGGGGDNRWWKFYRTFTVTGVTRQLSNTGMLLSQKRLSVSKGWEICGQMSIKKKKISHPILYCGLFLSGCVYILCWIQIFFPLERLLFLQDPQGLQRPKCDKILWKGKQTANPFSFSCLTPCNNSAHQQMHQTTEISTPAWVFPEEQLNLAVSMPGWKH